MPVNNAIFHAANFNASRPESVRIIHLVGKKITEGDDHEFDVPKGMSSVNRIVFDFTEFPLRPTEFTLRDDLNNVIGKITAGQRSAIKVLSINEFPMTPGNPPIPMLQAGDKLVLSWPPFTLASESSRPIGAPIRTRLMIQFYEDPNVINAEQIALMEKQFSRGLLRSNRGVGPQAV